MKKVLSLIALAAVFFASPSFAADPVVGTWKLNVAKSKFSTGAVLTAGTRVYTEANGLYTLDQKLTGADGKEMSNRVQYRDGKEEKQATAGPADTTLAKKIDANTWDFDLKKDGKVVGHVHRVVSADGKTLIGTQHRYAAERRQGRRDACVRQPVGFQKAARTGTCAHSPGHYASRRWKHRLAVAAYPKSERQLSGRDSGWLGSLGDIDQPTLGK
jgi:hypothetical protein